MVFATGTLFFAAGTEVPTPGPWSSWSGGWRLHKDRGFRS